MEPQGFTSLSLRILPEGPRQVEADLMRLFSLEGSELTRRTMAVIQRHLDIGKQRFESALIAVLLPIYSDLFYTLPDPGHRVLWAYLAVLCYLRRSMRQYSDDNGQPPATVEEILTEVFETICPLPTLTCNVNERTVDEMMLADTDDLTCAICQMWNSTPNYGICPANIGFTRNVSILGS